MRNATVQNVKELVQRACRQDTNYFGPGVWPYHIQPVVRFASLLAKRLKADREVVLLAALLHDYASIKKKTWYPQHHRHGSRLAKELLTPLGYPSDRIKQIQHCIEAHRASQGVKPRTLEAKIIADADHLAHFANAHSLLYLAFVRHRMGIDEGTRWVLDKLGQGWKKLTLPESKRLIQARYAAIKKALYVS